MNMRKYFLIIVGFFYAAAWTAAPAFAEYGKAPADIQATLFLKIFLFNNDLNKGKDIRIHVIDAPEFAAEIKKAEGNKIGKSKIVAVTAGSTLPDERPSIVYIGDPERTEEITQYTRAEHILSITGLPELVERGVTLGVGVVDKKPKILFNLSASKEENMDWNPVILEISTIVK